MRIRPPVPLILGLLLAVTAPPPGMTARLLAGRPYATKAAPQARGRSRVVVQVERSPAATAACLSPGPRRPRADRPVAHRDPVAPPRAARRAEALAPRVAHRLRC